MVRGALEATFPYGVWVEGEIRDLKRARNGHVYLDLVEPHEQAGQQPVATIPVVLFREAKDRVNALLKRHGDPIRMSDGVQVRIQGVLDFYPPSGKLQLRMTAIDPSYTLGRLAADRDALLQALTAEGLLRRNASHPLPELPLRVGVVTSLGSAAHADVMTVFENSSFAFTVVEVDAAMQGPGSEHGIAAAVNTAATLSDLVLVTRGGGSRTDLATFDHAVVARAIAKCNRPVFTGVGHDIDRSVADEVAHTAHTTPTAAAHAVVARVEAWLARLDDYALEAANRSRRAVQRAEHRVDRGVARLEVASNHGVRNAERRLESIATRVRALDPELALKRGWSITRRADGAIVRSTADVKSGDAITTQVADGSLTSTIRSDPA